MKVPLAYGCLISQKLQPDVISSTGMVVASVVERIM